MAFLEVTLTSLINLIGKLKVLLSQCYVKLEQDRTDEGCCDFITKLKNLLAITNWRNKFHDENLVHTFSQFFL